MFLLQGTRFLQISTCLDPKPLFLKRYLLNKFFPDRCF